METKQHTTKNQWVIEEIKKESIKINDNKNTAFQNLWDIAKAVLREIQQYRLTSRNKKNFKETI